MALSQLSRVRPQPREQFDAQVAALHRPPPETFLPLRPIHLTHGQPSVLKTLAGEMLAVVACTAALVVCVRLGASRAFNVIGTLALVSAVAAVRRVPFAASLTIGLGIALVLSRIS
jgi:hypothetical protein